MSRFINIIWLFVLFSFSATSSMAVEMNKSLVFKDDQVMMTQTLVLWERSIPQWIPQSCVTEAVEKGSAECDTPMRADQILTWFSFPIEVKHRTASATFDRTTTAFSFSRGEVIEAAPIRTLLFVIFPVLLPFAVCFGLLASYRYSVSKMRGFYWEFFLRFCVMSASVVAVSVFIGRFLLDQQWSFFPLAVATFGGLLFQSAISEAVGKWNWLFDVAVAGTSFLAFIALAVSAHDAGLIGAKMYEYFALMIGACAIAYAFFEAILSYRRRHGLISA